MNTSQIFLVHTGFKVAANLLFICLAVAFLASPLQAHAVQPKGGGLEASTVAKRKGSVKIKHQRSVSEESTPERERRMYRECRGLPNAGACRGFVQR